MDASPPPSSSRPVWHAPRREAVRALGAAVATALGLLRHQGTSSVSGESARQRNGRKNARAEKKKAKAKRGPTGPTGPAGPAGSGAGSGPAGPTGPAGPAGPIGLTGEPGTPGAIGPAGISGWEIVTTVPNPMSEATSAWATCPNGKRVLGGGYQIVSWQFGFIPMVLTNRDLLGNRWSVTVENVGTPGSGCQIVVTAICANVT